MKPTRIRMCHSLVMNYGLYKKMEIFVGHWALRRHIHSSYQFSREQNLQRKEKWHNFTLMNMSTFSVGSHRVTWTPMSRSSINVTTIYIAKRTSAHLPADNVGDDCPVFDGLFEYCAISAGGSMGRRFTAYYVVCRPLTRYFIQREQRD